MLRVAGKKWWALVAVVLLAAFWAGGSPVWAEETAMSMDDLIQLALSHDPAYQSAEIAVEKAQTAVKLATGGALPQAGLEANAGLPAGDDMAGRLISFTVSQSLSVRGLGVFGTAAAGDVEVTLWDLGHATLQRDRALLETRTAVYQRVMDVLEAQAVLDSSQRALKVADDGLKRTRRLIELGTATQLDELSYRSSVLNATAGVAAAQENLQSALNTLERLLGRKVAVGDLPTDFMVDPHVISDDVADTLLPKAVDQSPDVSSRAIALQKARRNLALLSNKYRPQVTLNGNAATTGASATVTLNLTTGQIAWSAGVLPGQWVFSPTSTKEELSANAKVMWNLWDWGEARMEKSRAEQDVQLAEMALSEARRSLAFALQDAVARANAAFRRWETAMERLNLAQERLRLQQIRSDLGVVAVDDLIAAEESTAEARTALVQAQYDWVSAILVLDQAAGVAPVASRF